MSNVPPPSRPHVSLATTEPTTFGYGWLSGVLSAALGGMGLLVVLCFHFPQWLTMPVLRASPHVDSTAEDLEQFADALAAATDQV